MGFSGQEEIVNIKKGLRIKKKNLGRAVFFLSDENKILKQWVKRPQVRISNGSKSLSV